MKHLKLFIILIIILVNIFVLSLFFFNQNKKEFEITFLDVGQGNGVGIKTLDKKILIDAGNGMKALKKIYSYSGFFDHSFDLVFLSHYDIDHVGLLPFLIQNFELDYIFETSAYNNCAIRDEIIKRLEKKDYQIFELSSGAVFEIDKNTKIEVLFPEPFFKPDVLNDNEGSLVLRVVHKNKTFLIMGDLPKKFEKYLIKKYGNYLKSDVLMVGHHGSKTSSFYDFLKIVDPEYLIISVGENNSYGMPHQEILDNAKKLKIKILRTDEVGDIKFFLDKNILKVKY